MHRLFVAIRPPEPVRTQLLDLMEGVAGARWQDDDQLHLTLRFIGEVDRHAADGIHAALSTLRHPSFEIALRGLGLFDKRGKPTTLWAGVSPHEALGALQRKVDQALVRAGLPPETRAFHPHITLARVNRSTGPLDPFLSRSGTVSSPPFSVDSFALYESRLTQDGAVYSEIDRFTLA